MSEAVAVGAAPGARHGARHCAPLHPSQRPFSTTHDSLLHRAILITLPFLLAACATKPSRIVDMTALSVPGTTLASDGIESVRYAENIKTYPLGRYVERCQRKTERSSAGKGDFAVVPMASSEQLQHRK